MLQKIGNIVFRININDAGQPFARADFLFRPEFGSLDASYDFQWVQRVTGYTIGGVQQTDPGGNPIAPGLGRIPAIDPQTGDGPEPYYYNADEWGSGMFGTTSIREDGLRSTFIDRKSNHPNGTVITFETFLVVDDRTVGGFPDNQFCVLNGFRWTHTRDATGPGYVNAFVADLGPDPAGIDAAIALASPAFPLVGGANWDAIDSCPLQITNIPTVSGWSVVVMMLLVLTAGTIVIRRSKCERPIAT